jgi:hypothetical protein
MKGAGEITASSEVVLFMNREQDQMILKVIKNKFGKA